MRKVTYGGAISLDGYLAGQDDSVDWLMWCDEAAEVTNAYWKNVDVILMGRRTFEIAMRNQPAESEASNPYGDITTYVFSSTLTQPDVKGAELITGNAGEFVNALKKEPGKEICVMGGGILAASLLEAGAIDEVGFNIHPVLLGSGIPAFPRMSSQIGLELIESRPFQNGCVYCVHRVKY